VAKTLFRMQAAGYNIGEFGVGNFDVLGSPPVGYIRLAFLSKAEAAVFRLHAI
jgi:hypothetical protein